MSEITVIIPTYNDEEYIRDAINSVLTQDCHDWQLIVVNDCSTDKTKEIVEGYESAFPNKIKLINNEKNSGVGISRKKGLEACTTPFVTFLDSDDLLTRDYIKNCILLQEQQDVDVVYTSFTILWPEQNVTKKLDAGEFLLQGEATPQSHFNSTLKFLTGKVFRTDLLKSIPWSENRVGEDVQTLFFATYKANKVRTSSYSGYIHRFRPNSLLADAPFFFCYCYSTLAELEIIDWLFDQKDEKIYNYLMKLSYTNFKKALEVVDSDEHGLKATGTHKGEYVGEKWKYIKKWFKDREQIFKIMEFDEKNTIK